MADDLDDEPRTSSTRAAEQRRLDVAHDVEILRRCGPDPEADAIAAWRRSVPYTALD